MYVGPWEVVGKKKDKNASKTGNNKLTKTEKKKFIENAPKVEDFLPLDQVRTLYDNLGSNNKENKKPPKEKDNKTKENEEKKKQKSPQQEKKEKNKEEPPKEKTPKSIEEALNNLKLMELQDLLASNQLRFPEAPLVWLKALVSFLNSKIPVEKDDPIFTGRPESYPLSVVPKNIRISLEKSIESAGPPNVRLFYEYLLTAMTMEATKGVPIVGYKIFVQLLAKYDHKLTLSNIPKLIVMRNSYQNRKPIAMSLLWSFNQGGRENFDTGLKVWHEVMSPMMEAKSYVGPVMKILNDLIMWHNDDENLHPDNYLNIFEDLFSGKLSSSQSFINEATVTLKNLRSILFQNKNMNNRKLFETLVSKVTTKSPDFYKQEVIEALLDCLIADDKCYSVWKSLFMKHLHLSTDLLTYIDNRWDSLQQSINKNLMIEMLSSFKFSNDKTKRGKGKDDKYLQTCKKINMALTKKMSSKPSRRGFPWKTGCFLLMVTIGAILAYDVQKKGSFEATSTGKFLRNSGVTEFVNSCWDSTKLYTNKGLKLIEASSPEYYKAVVEFSSPYVKLIGDVFLTLKSMSIKLYQNIIAYFTTVTPKLISSIEHYAPGLIESVKAYSYKGLESIQSYSILCADKTIEYSAQAATWMKNNVFVGKLSPENLQDYAKQAINTTQTVVSQTYDWVYKKVQTLSKID